MDIRKATTTDIDTIVKHNCLMAVETENKELDEPTVKKGVTAVLNDEAKGFYLVAEIKGQPVANLMITFEWSDWRNSNIWWVQSVYVARLHRQKGIYKALYDVAKQLAVQQGVKVIRLYVEQQNTVAQQVYQKLGMQHSYYYLYEADL